MSGDPRIADSSGLRQLQVAAKSSEERWQKLAYTLNESPIRYESRSYSTSSIVFPPYRVKKKNTSNRGDDKEAAKKDSVQVSEGFTFDLAERRRTFA